MRIRPTATLPARLGGRVVEVAPGVAVCVVVALVATVIGALVPVIGSALPAIVIGVGIALVRRPGTRIRPGIAYSSRFLLQCAVVLLGAQLSLGAIARVGLESLPVMLVSLAACLVAAALVGRALRVERRARTMIGVGTGICGASAIAAVAPVIGAASAEVAYAVSTIFLFNVVAVVLFPLVGHALGMSPHVFGLFAGTAVNDTSSVAAAASVFSTGALGFAIVVKLVRTLMIVPISVGLAVVEARRRQSGSGDALTARRVLGFVPWFLVGFVLVAVLVTAIPPSPPAHDALVRIGVFLISIALAGIGLSTDAGAIRAAGWRPLLLGLVLWTVVIGSSLGMLTATGALG